MKDRTKGLIKILIILGLFAVIIAYAIHPPFKESANNFIMSLRANLTSLLSGVMSTPFWINNIAPNRFWIGLALGGLTIFIITRLWVRIRRFAVKSAHTEVGFQQGPTYTAPQPISQQPAQTTPQSVEKQEGE